MKTLGDAKENLDKWCPVIFVYLLGVVFVPLRLLVFSLLPSDSRFSWHKLYKFREYWYW